MNASLSLDLFYGKLKTQSKDSLIINIYEDNIARKGGEKLNFVESITAQSFCIFIKQDSRIHNCCQLPWSNDAAASR